MVTHNFQVGDKVTLWGGSPVMKVVELTRGMVVCGYHSKKHGWQQHRLYPEQITRQLNDSCNEISR